MDAPGFLTLPAELRLEVYGKQNPPRIEPETYTDCDSAYINSHNTVSISRYKGLYLSCRQIKEEMDDACIKRPGQVMEQVWDNGGSDFLIEFPKTFSKARQAVIGIPSGPLLEKHNVPETANIHKLLTLPLDLIKINLIYPGNEDESHQLQANASFFRWACVVRHSRLAITEPLTHKIVFKNAAVQLYTRT
jgi:hypothetical protein